MTGPWPEKGQFIWKCFTFARDRPVFNNKHICPTISSETVINCPAGTPMPQRAHTLLFPNLWNILLWTKETNTETTRRICAPTGNWGKKKKKNPTNNCSLFHLYRSQNLSLNLGYSSVWSCTHVVYCRRSRQWKHFMATVQLLYMPVDGLQSTSMRSNKSCHLLHNPHDEYFWK